MKLRIQTVCGTIAVSAMAVALAGCASLGYYVQAAQGQMNLLSEARPVDEWLADGHTDTRLRQRLEKAREIRRFAVAELGLPDNASYTKYASLKSPFVLWNVVATPELSLKPIEWCFPVAGCVNYRGYYQREAAQAYAHELRAEGKDVQVGGVTAYSTLGWFDDPLLSTFINTSDAELARLIFHELAHQIVYIKGDSQFNESFATAVEEAGVQRWLDVHGDPALRQSYTRYTERKSQFMALLLRTRRQLEANYASGRSAEEQRAVKQRLFQQLKDDYVPLKQSWGGYAGYDRWFAEPLSNAHLAAIATYTDFVPAFEQLLAQQGSFPKFYAAVHQLAELDRAERHRRLSPPSHS
jgi:predicted aminopeptidase